MSFFNLRRGGQSSKTTASQSAPAESLEIVRKRAKHRLIGSAVLVLVGVIGFPLLFDTQPRPVSVGIPIDIPSKQGVKPLPLPAPLANAEAPVTPGANELVAAAAAPVAADKPAEKQDEKSAEKPIEKASDKASDKANTPSQKTSDEAARAQSLLNGANSAQATVSAAATATPSPSPAAAPAVGEMRLVVQVGAFADVAKAREARLKLEKAGLKTYTQVAETKDGKRIRVRVGPYASKAEADKAAKQIKALGLPAALLTL